MFVSGESWCRVRTIATANTTHPMRSFLFRCQGIKNIRPYGRDYSNPDIRRVDLFIPSAMKDVSNETIADSVFPNHPVTPSKPNLIRKHILWAWQLTPNDFMIEKDAMDAIKTEFVELANEHKAVTDDVVRIQRISEARRSAEHVESASTRVYDAGVSALPST